jgi:hypothetical protein
VSERKPLLIVVDDAPGMLGLIERALQLVRLPRGRVELYARAREGQPQAHTQRRPADKGRDDRTLTQDLHAVERDHIARVLAEAHGNKRAARPAARSEPADPVPPARAISLAG